jgi:hypothetical protein
VSRKDKFFAGIYGIEENNTIVIVMSPDMYSFIFPSTPKFLPIGTPIYHVNFFLVPREICNLGQVTYSLYRMAAKRLANK